MTRYIQRHSLLTRVTHGVAAVACILLAVTGLFVFVPSLGGGLMGGDFTYAMRMLHRVLAIPFVLVPLFAILKSPKGFVHLMRDDVFGKWDKDDVAWAMKFPLYLFAPGKVHMPPQHHVKSAQRLADGALIFFCVFLAVSGMILWLNTGLLPDGSWKVTFSPETLLVELEGDLQPRDAPRRASRARRLLLPHGLRRDRPHLSRCGDLPAVPRHRPHHVRRREGERIRCRLSLGVLGQ